jgi:hypothetical protein
VLRPLLVCARVQTPTHTQKHDHSRASAALGRKTHADRRTAAQQCAVSPSVAPAHCAPARQRVQRVGHVSSSRATRAQRDAQANFSLVVRSSFLAPSFRSDKRKFSFPTVSVLVVHWCVLFWVPLMCFVSFVCARVACAFRCEKNTFFSPNALLSLFRARAMRVSVSLATLPTSFRFVFVLHFFCAACFCSSVCTDGSGGREECRDFKRGLCHRGSSCRYYHAPGLEGTLRTTIQFCRDFQ